MKFSQQLQRIDACFIRPSPGLWGTSMSSKTPGRDMVEKWSLKMLNPYKTFTEAFEGWFLSSDTTSRFIRNLHVLQDSRKRLGGQVESWQGFWCWILMKLSQKLLKDDPYHMTPPPGSSGTSTSSKTPGRDLEDRWSLDKVSDFRSWWNFHRSFWSMIPIKWHHLQVHQESPHPLRLQEETWRTGGALTGFLLFPSFSGTSTSSRLQGETWRIGGALTGFLLFPSFSGTSTSS